MTGRRFQDIWNEQCEAARGVRERHGVVSALDYLIGEKLMTYAETAVGRPEFARELPRFVAEIRASLARRRSALSRASGTDGCTGRARIVGRACGRRLHSRDAGATHGTESAIGLAEGALDCECVGDGVSGSPGQAASKSRPSQQCGRQARLLFAYPPGACEAAFLSPVQQSASLRSTNRT
jgi:hypothetical protein